MTSLEIKDTKSFIIDNDLYELRSQRSELADSINTILTVKKNRLSNELTSDEEHSLESYQAAADVIDELIEGYEAIIETYDKALKIRYFGGKR